MTNSNTLRIVIATIGMFALVGCGSVSQVDAESGTSSTSSESPAGSSDDTAREQLNELTVAPEGSMNGYDRDEFPHWTNHGENCNTRELVLKRDGDDVETGADCYPTSGSWSSPYDGQTWTDPSDLDIDHLVPLAEAWRTGAADWTREEREQFANDLEGVNLLAVTDSVNQSKGDSGPEAWKPPLKSYWCTYATDWIDVKHTWDLTVDEEEKAALAEMLDRC